MVETKSENRVRDAASVPYVTADEACFLLRVQLDRLIALVESLDPEDWSRPTACTLWDVHDIMAHQAGGYASGTSYWEMIRQYTHLPKKGQLPEDAINEFQVRSRANRSPQELIAELKAAGPVAIQKWAYQFRVIKPVAIPHPVSGTLSLRHLMWIIHSRDTWMHRLDICRATGREFIQTAQDDGRIAALVMLDAEKALRRKIGDPAVIFDLTGPAGGTWKLGAGEPAAAIQMDVLDFNILASGRYSYDEGRARASISGDTNHAGRVLKNLLVLY